MCIFVNHCPMAPRFFYKRLDPDLKFISLLHKKGFTSEIEKAVSYMQDITVMAKL